MASFQPPVRILVVEDEWLIADQIVAMLQDAGYQVAGPVNDIDDALAILGSQAIHAAVLDVNLGDIRTFSLATRLLEANIGFVFVTGYATIDLPCEMRGQPLLQKPTDLTVLKRTIEQLLPALSGDDSGP
jgi:DNA-binding response OmpR family regulator